MKIEGGCHCGLVRFEADVPEQTLEVQDCNCSICSMTAYLHLIVPEKDFRIVEGRRETTTYRFGSGTAQHIFCAQCGIKSFYKPRSHPNGISINLRCLDDPDMLDYRVVAFDGKNHPGAVAS
jgi:hypothetical protein